MVIVWPVGIPVLYFVLLWRSRHELRKGIPTPLSRATAFLSDDCASPHLDHPPPSGLRRSPARHTPQFTTADAGLTRLTALCSQMITASGCRSHFGNRSRCVAS
eukprot:4921956-Prymnesium_polylepis.1